jgi:WG containing repeat
MRNKELKYLILLLCFIYAQYSNAQLKEWAIQPQFDDVRLTFYLGQKEIVFIKQNNTWGIANHIGEILVTPQFDSINYSDNDFFAKVLVNKKVGLFSYKARKLSVKPEYDDVYAPDHRYIAVQKGDLWGVMDSMGNVIAPFNFKGTAHFDYTKKAYYAKNNVKIDTMLVLPKPYKYLVPLVFQDYIFKSLPKSLPQNLNPNPIRELFKFKYERIEEKEIKNEIVMPPIIGATKSFIIKRLGDNQFTICNSIYRPVSKDTFSFVNEFGTHFFKVQKEPNGKFALWDAEKETYKTKFIYDVIWLYSPSRDFLFKRDNKFGFIDAKGDEVVPPTYDNGIIQTEFVIIQSSKKSGLMNKKNEWFLPLEYDAIVTISNERGAWVKQNGKWGLMRFYW